MKKTTSRLAAVAMLAGIGMASIAGVAGASEPTTAPATHVAAAAEDEKGPVGQIVGGLGDLLGGVAGTVDGLIGGLGL